MTEDVHPSPITGSLSLSLQFLAYKAGNVVGCPRQCEQDARHTCSGKCCKWNKHTGRHECRQGVEAIDSCAEPHLVLLQGSARARISTPARVGRVLVGRSSTRVGGSSTRVGKSSTRANVMEERVDTSAGRSSSPMVEEGVGTSNVPGSGMPRFLVCSLAWPVSTSSLATAPALARQSSSGSSEDVTPLEEQRQRKAAIEQPSSGSSSLATVVEQPCPGPPIPATASALAEQPVAGCEPVEQMILLPAGVIPPPQATASSWPSSSGSSNFTVVENPSAEPPGLATASALAEQPGAVGEPVEQIRLVSTTLLVEQEGAVVAPVVATLEQIRQRRKDTPRAPKEFQKNNIALK